MGDAAEWQRAVFSVGSRQVTIRDVLQAAHSRGELDSAWAEVCRRAEGPDAEAGDADAVQAASEEFRSERDLITAEETEQWLEQRGLTLEEFGGYFARCQAEPAPVARGEDDPPAALDEHAPRERLDLLRIDLLMSGEFDRLAERLAWRFAAREASDPPLSPDPEHEPRELEGVYQQRRAELLTPEAREDALTFLHLPLTRFELEVFEADSLDAAREALLCLTEDGETMAQVARDGGYPLRRRCWWAREVAADLQTRILSASKGEVFGPVANGDQFEIYRLVRKIEPHLTDKEVSAQVDDHLVRSHFAELAAKHIHWIIAPASAHA